MKRSVHLLALLAAPAFLSACSSVSLPNVDFLKLPEFQEEAKNVKDYPNISEAPALPTDLRSASAWDTAANDLISARDGFAIPEDAQPAKTEAEILNEFKELREKVNAYKKDDPQ